MCYVVSRNPLPKSGISAQKNTGMTGRNEFSFRQYISIRLKVHLFDIMYNHSKKRGSKKQAETTGSLDFNAKPEAFPPNIARVAVEAVE